MQIDGGGLLDDGGTIQAADQFMVKRGGTNVRVIPGTAVTKAASDSDEDVLASVSGEIIPGHMAVFTDEDGTIGDGGEVPIGIEALLEADILESVSLGDLIPVVRDGVLYLATVANVLAATSATSAFLMEDDGYILQEDGSKILIEE